MFFLGIIPSPNITAGNIIPPPPLYKPKTTINQESHFFLLAPSCTFFQSGIVSVVNAVTQNFVVFKQKSPQKKRQNVRNKQKKTPPNPTNPPPKDDFNNGVSTKKVFPNNQQPAFPIPWPCARYHLLASCWLLGPYRNR